MKSIKDNLVSFILLGVVLSGIAYLQVGWDTEKHLHWNGDEGFRGHWHVWVVFNYLQGIAMCATRLVKEFSTIDKIVVRNFIAFDAYSLLVYMYAGWPLRNDLIVIGFCLGCIAFVIEMKWRKSN